MDNDEDALPATDVITVTSRVKSLPAWEAKTFDMVTVPVRVRYHDELR